MLMKIRQVDICGCGIACIAMVTHNSYAEIARLADLHLKRKWRKKGTSTKEVAQLVALTGFESPKRLITFRSLQHTDLRVNSILKVPRDAGGNWHWVVWDAKYERILDPWPDASKGCRITSYLPITRR